MTPAVSDLHSFERVSEETDDLQNALAASGLVKQTVDDWLNQVDYGELNSGNYVPSEFALQYVNFVKMVNGVEGEQNVTPVVHYKMLDQIAGTKTRIANLCHRGLGKTTVMGEYLLPFIGVFGGIPGFGEIEGIIYVSDSMDNGAKSLRKNIEFRYNNSEFLQRMLPKATFTDAYIEFTNLDGHRVGIRLYGAKTGLRGTKIFGKRPVLAILDDLVSDEDAKSAASMRTIKDTVYKGVDYALDPRRRKIILSGTPFNKNDILYEAVESGGWHVNVYPICEKFPCSREDFHGSWEDRFTYDFVLEQYQLALATGKMDSFMQELMLRITSDEERLVQDAEIRWYSRAALLSNKSRFNFYITTDFTTSAKQSADNAVISVWAYNSNGDWFWVDGICEKQTMDKNIDALFRLVQAYRPQSVGVEISGQQGAFITWLQKEMMSRNIWFNFASNNKSREPGIRPASDKLTRFNGVLPLFKAGKMYFPTELKASKIMGEFMSEISLCTVSGIKAKHDDCIDTISMLMYLDAWKPSEDSPMTEAENGLWEMDDEFSGDTPPIQSYIV